MPDDVKVLYEEFPEDRPHTQRVLIEADRITNSMLSRDRVYVSRRRRIRNVEVYVRLQKQILNNLRHLTFETVFDMDQSKFAEWIANLTDLLSMDERYAMIEYLQRSIDEINAKKAAEPETPPVDDPPLSA